MHGVNENRDKDCRAKDHKVSVSPRQLYQTVSTNSLFEQH